MRKLKESENNVDAGWDGPDWRKNGFYGIVYDDRNELDRSEYIIPCFMKIDATPDKAFYGWSYWDILENSEKFIKKVEETGDTTHDVSKDGPLFVDLALWMKDPFDQGPQDKMQFEDDWLPRCRAFCSGKYEPNKIFATEYPKRTVERLELELSAMGKTANWYFDRIEDLCGKIRSKDIPPEGSNWVYPF